MVIQAEALHKAYREKVAVQDISLSVPEGEIFGLLGPNGAGKSTLIKMLIGLVFPTRGSGSVLGQPLGDLRARKRMGYLPELFRFQDWMTGLDLIRFHEDLFGLKRDSGREKAVLSRVGMLGQEKRKVGAYSKGMQQRLGLALALLPDPALLFLDEPTSALDPIGRADVRDIILSLKREGRTVFLNSHLLSEVEAVSDSVAIIHRGAVVKAGPMRALLAGKSTLRIRVDRWNESAIALLRAHGLKETPADGQSCEIPIASEDEIPTIAQGLIAAGCALYALTPERETLEQLFLDLVREVDRP